MIIYNIERIFRKEVSQMKRTSPNSVVLLQRTAWVSLQVGEMRSRGGPGAHEHHDDADVDADADDNGDHYYKLVLSSWSLSLYYHHYTIIKTSFMMIIMMMTIISLLFDITILYCYIIIIIIIVYYNDDPPAVSLFFRKIHPPLGADALNFFLLNHLQSARLTLGPSCPEWFNLASWWKPMFNR